MALTKCKECQHTVSTTAKTCPSCGYNLKSMSPFTKVILTLFLLVIFLPFIGVFAPDKNNNSRPVNAPAKTTASLRAEKLDSLCQDMVYQKAKMYKYTREGDHKAAYAAEKLFMAFSEDLAQYTDNEVKMACNKYDNYEYMKRYL